MISQCFSWRWLPWPAHWNALPSSRTIINLYLLSVAQGKVAMKNVSRIAFVLSNTRMHVLLWRCLGGCMCSWTGLSGRNKKNPKHLSRNSSCTRACCPCFACKHTGVLECAAGILSALKSASEGELWVLSHADTAWAGTHYVCISPPTPPQQYAYMCLCVFEETQIGPWDFWVFWLCQGDHYCGVQGQAARPEGPDTSCVWIRDVGSFNAHFLSS